MKLRLFLMMCAVLAVTACGSKDDIQEGMDSTNEAITTTDPMDNNMGNGNVVPGSNEDLVVNVGDRVFFGYDQYNLSDEARNVLSMQAEWLKQYANVNVIIEGHADERGTREYNLALGERRAIAAKNYLVASGIDPSRVSVISYGKERPAVGGSTPGAWAQNRRSVTIVE